MRKNLVLILVAGVFAAVAAHSAQGAEPVVPKVSPQAVQPDMPDGPVVFFPETRFTFDRILEGADITHDFPVRNIGSELLRIKRIKST
ncbi:MAG: hypothetical protein ACLFOY_13255 [Desulfatibacillaceae bacterium]